ncbi:HDOD domain-containing protein [Curvibacter sp. APW13]|uniref:protein kinase domain-containing protein n=1 Tax=Curvibacter sp. APW13 TaxID=3077236 RepID=UPI0028DEA84B|nr:HDOD domain-containing protein [Curvibacter sp. APW13]MDT8991743.1 HDOD domain-containing protein [Curvibacter sp. APW13]
MAESPQFSNSRPNPAAVRGAALGRFELRKRLGQGAQSTVYLGFDPRLEREVAIKVMRLGSGSDEHAVSQWLQEARSAGRVTHPNIVPVYEADIQDRQPYLVFEYVDGRTLAAMLKESGAMPAPAAVALVLDVLDALAAAHTAQVVHRDLKPSNILVDKAGRARVMDFGIAARIRDASSMAPDTPSGGTPGYLSPEAASGAAPAPSMDIFSVGMVLAEMLLGAPLIAEQDPYRAIYRVLHEQLMFPAQAGLDVDERLRSIVTRALAKDPRQRYPSARAFMAELESWSKSGTDAQQLESQTKSANNRDTLDFLLRRMRHKSDFPALSESIVRIQSMATSDKESINSVTNEILKDVALTNKLLRLVNSAQFARGGSISTVSRAVSLVGFNGIRNMALSLVLLEHMSDKAHAAQLKEEFLRSLMAGSIGAELCPTVRESEETFIGAMFQNLGRLLVQYYFPEEARAVRTLVQNTREPVTEQAAAINVLGMSFEDLGQGIAKAWGLPTSLVRCMSKPQGAPPQTAPADAMERQRWVAMAANDIADVLLHAEPQDVERKIEQAAARYVRAMGLSPKDVQAATVKARKKLVELASAMEIRVAPQSAAAKLLQVPAESTEQGSAEASPAHGSLSGLELQATHTRMADAAHAGADAAVTSLRAAMGETLAAGIQDITNAMVEDFKLVDVLRMILETMFRAMELDRIIFCMRDAKTEMMTGRFGLGQGVDAHVKTFRTHLKAPTPDLFAIVCSKGADTMISDASEARIAQRLPNWYRAGLNAPAFLLLPLQIKGGPFGLIYADKVQHGSLVLDEKELALLRTLRNQAVMAFKQSQ